MYRMDIAEVIEVDVTVANSYLDIGWLLLNTHTRADTLPMDNGPLPTQTTVYVLGRPRAVPPGMTDTHRAAVIAASPKPRPRLFAHWREEPPPSQPVDQPPFAPSPIPTGLPGDEDESIDDIPF